MKLLSFDLNRRLESPSAVGLTLWNETAALDKDHVHVEIHSLDDPSWTTERPEKWGVGCWCRFGRGCGLVIGFTQWGRDVNYTVLQPGNGVVFEVCLNAITAFGPRAECPQGGEG